MRSLKPGRKRMMTVLLLGLLLLTLSSKGEVAPKSPEIQVELKHKGSFTLTVTLRSATTVKVTESFLPWVAPHPKFTLVVASLGGICIEKSSDINDSFLGPVDLKRGVPLSGDIDLEAEFPGLRNYLKIDGVHVFWAYEWPNNLSAGKWSSGRIYLPKQN